MEIYKLFVYYDTRKFSFMCKNVYSYLTFKRIDKEIIFLSYIYEKKLFLTSR